MNSMSEEYQWVSEFPKDGEEEHPECEHIGGMGGWVDGESLDAMVTSSNPAYECARSFYDAVIERYPAPELPHGGFYKQDGYDGVPVLPCGGTPALSMRAWGDWMAMIINERDDTDEYSYVDFAWYVRGKEEYA